MNNQHNSDGSLISETIFVFVKIDSLEANAFDTHRKNDKNSAERFQKTSTEKFFQVVFQKLFIRSSDTFLYLVSKCFLHELQISFFSLSGHNSELSKPAWNATVAVVAPPVQWSLAAVLDKWFTRCINSYLSNTPSCRILGYNFDSSGKVMLCTSFSCEHVKFEKFSLSMNENVVQTERRYMFYSYSIWCNVITSYKKCFCFQNQVIRIYNQNTTNLNQVSTVSIFIYLSFGDASCFLQKY